MNRSGAAPLNATGRGSREDTRESRDTLSTPPAVDWHAAVGDLFERVCAANGGAKGLAGGLVPLSYPHIRRLSGDGALPNLEQILLFMRLAGPKDPFREQLRDFLDRMFEPTPDQVAALIEERVAAGAQIGDAVREALGVRPLWPDVQPRPLKGRR
jgi:hypothetical protein